MDNYEPIGLSHFFGGWSTDRELGSDAQFYYSKHIDFRKAPSSATLLPKPTNADGGVVVDLVQGMEQIGTGVRYAIGDAGYLYRIAVDGTWSTVTNIGEAGSAGILYRSDVDHLYIAGQTKVSRISRVSTTATLQNNWFDKGISTATTCFRTGGTNTYTIPTTLSEDTINERFFTSDIEPVCQIGVRVVAKGTGTLTLTLHDDANNVLGTASLTTGNVTAGTVNYFVFSNPIRIQRGNNGQGSALTYHYHLTSTVGDTTIATTTANSMADCDMELWANALVPTKNNLHPITQLSNATLIGNGRYVAQYEPLQDNPTTADFLRHRLTLPPGFEVCGFAQKNLMVVVGAEKRSDSGEFQEGALFFWDGVAETYNDFWLVPEGSPEALFSHKNVVYFIASGSLYRMRGGDEPIKIRTFRNTDSEYSSVTDNTHVYPNMMTVRRNILLIGYPSTTTNVNLEYGVYSLGSITNEYPESFGYSYTTSNGTNLVDGSNDLKIGMVKNYGDTLYISWRDDSASPQQYSVDKVDNSSPPASTGQLDTLSFDAGKPYKYKRAGYIIATFETLPANTSVTVKWKIDGGVWNYSETATSGNSLVAPIGSQGGLDYLKIEFGVDITCDGTVSPDMSGIYLFTDLLKNQRPIGG